MNHNHTGLGTWSLDPEGAKDRKLLAIRGRCTDGNPTSRQAIDLPFGHGAKVAGSLEDHTFIEVIGAVEGCPQPEAREICNGRVGRELYARSKGKEIRRIEQAPR